MSLGAMKQFKQATGKDLWFTLISFIEAYSDSIDLEPISRMRHLYSIIDFEDAAQLFYAVIKSENKSIPLSEIEDAMFRVGWLPNENTDELSNPWPLVMAVLAHDVDDSFKDLPVKKKPVIEAALKRN